MTGLSFLQRGDIPKRFLRATILVPLRAKSRLPWLSSPNNSFPIGLIRQNDFGGLSLVGFCRGPQGCSPSRIKSPFRFDLWVRGPGSGFDISAPGTSKRSAGNAKISPARPTSGVVRQLKQRRPSHHKTAASHLVPRSSCPVIDRLRRVG